MRTLALAVRTVLQEPEGGARVKVIALSVTGTVQPAPPGVTPERCLTTADLRKCF